MRCQKITVVHVKPRDDPLDVNDDLQYIGAALGLFNPRDKDKSKFRIFIALIKSANRRQGLTSDELAEQLGITRATILHHIDQLTEAGIVEGMHGRFLLRVDSLEELFDVIEQDVTRTLKDAKNIARNVDIELGLKHSVKRVKNKTPV